jgi:hypothetical protein
MRRDIPGARLRILPEGGRGLSAGEVAERQRRFGWNEIAEVAAQPWVDLARDTAKDPMIWFLVVTGIAYAALGSTVEAVTLLIGIVPLVGMDAFLHRRTRASTEGLSRKLAQRARATRDGKEAVVPATDLVPGDLVAVGTGEPSSRPCPLFHQRTTARSGSTARTGDSRERASSRARRRFASSSPAVRRSTARSSTPPGRVRAVARRFSARSAAS